MHPSNPSQLDHATTQRLARLSTAPVDTSRLEQRLAHHLKRETTARPSMLSMLRWRPAAGIAAAVLIAVLVGVMSLTGPSAQASPMDLHRVHQAVVAGSLPAIEVADVAGARAQLASLIEAAPRPTGDYPPRLRCCCGHELDGELLAFIKLQHRGRPITVIMMRGHHVCADMDQTMVDESGRRFTVHHDASGVQATLTTQADHWICVLGELSTEQLLSVARQLAI
jgi:hypothetical protein